MTRPSPPPPTRLHHRYRLERPLGRGGAGTTYLALDEVRRRPVALKLLGSGRPELVRAFRAEFTTLTGLLHPNLALVHDFGALATADAAPRLFYTSEFIDGSTLDRFAADARWPEVREALVGGLRALDLLHQLGLRHGDLKPQNILVSRDGRGVLIDLGCTRPLDGAPDPSPAGTPGYLAPELLRGEVADQRADLYSLGVTLEALHPPRPLAPLVTALTAPDPRHRPGDVAEVLESLGAEPPPRHLAPAHPPQLIGRQAEVAALERLIEQTHHNTPGARALFLLGPEGVGRSRLLQEAKWQAQLVAAVVEGVADDPLALTSMLRRATGRLDLAATLEATLDAARELARGDQATLLVLDDLHRVTPPQRNFLLALTRSLEPKGHLALITSAIGPLRAPDDQALILELAPLDADALERWAGDRLAPPVRREILRLSGGFPSNISALLGSLRTGDITASDLRALPDSSHASSRRLERLERLTRPAQRALAAVAASDHRLTIERLEALELDRAATSDLAQRGWLQSTTEGLELVRAAEAKAILATLNQDLVRQTQHDLARALESPAHESEDRPQRSARLAARVTHLAEAGHLDEAAALFAQELELAQTFPDRWPRAVEALAPRSDSPQVALCCAAVLEAAGHPERAVATLERAAAPEHQLPPSVRDELQHQLAEAWLRLGDAARALDILSEIRADETEPTPRARRLDLLARALIKSGRYERAAEVASEALEQPPTDESLQAALEQDLGVAKSYLGEVTAAREHLSRAASLTSAESDPRQSYRRLSYEALNEYRAGDVRAAAQRYAQALELALEHDLGDEGPTAALNLGAAAHQLGELARALRSYERGLPIARALGKVSTEATLQANLAQLNLDLGLFPRAERQLQRAEQLAERAGLVFTTAVVESIRGDLARVQGDLIEAQSALNHSLELFTAEGATREAAEVDLQLAEVLLESGALDQAAENIGTAASRGPTSDDLEAAISLTRGRLALRRDQAERALTELERALARAQPSGRSELSAAIEAALSQLHSRPGGSPLLAERHRQRAQELWERMTVGLSPQAREAFWSHPKHAIPTPAAATSPPSRNADDRTQRLEQLLAINRKLNSSLRTRDVLEATMDAAIELTRAERGFLLEVPKDFDGDLSRVEVAIARNLDREKIGRSHLKLSRGIAEEVIRTGSPVATIDASADERFSGHESVHAMRLKSVAAVPIQTPQGIIGALYLDNRFQRGRFAPDDIETLLALADQAALALSNARLHDELAQRARELEREQKRVEELAAGQARQIDDLVRQVQTKQEVLEHRYDYGNIIGRSPAMQRVFALLDQVTDLPATVLIQGESGTGKELIARTLHFNSPRREGPFVAINCGALPETLLESELFGHKRGAFTGAERDREGLFVAARGGTLLLDELGEMPASMQVKLLRVLEQREVRPLGSTSDIPIDIRLVCATNRPLRRLVSEGEFRADLFYRLGVVELDLPPLRERLEDIPTVAEHLLERIAESSGRPALALTPSALRGLMTYHWPGNVRQLENTLTKALLLTSGEAITLADLDLPTLTPSPREAALDREGFEREEGARILATLRAERWNVSKVARLLGIPRPTLYRKLKRLGIKRGD